MNAGLDSALELGKVSSSAGIFTSRVLIKFPLAKISSSILSGDIYNPKYYMNLYQSKTHEMQPQYNLIAFAVSNSWDAGSGRKIDPTSRTQFIKQGSSWTYRNKKHPEIEYIPSKDIQWTSQSLNADSTMLYSSVTGGGTWYTDYYASQSFDHSTADMRMDVTPIVNYLIGTGSGYTGTSRMKSDGSNDGFIIMRSGSQETDATEYGNLQFFSRETNTVYQPRLEVVYDDSSFITASLTELTSEQSVLYLKNLKHEYSRREEPKIRVVGRERYPEKTFSTESNYKSIKYLPTSSYYGVKDALTDEFVIPYSYLGTKLSCDSNGNYIKMNMNSFMPERYYKLCFQVTQSDASVVVYDENFYFKVNR
tara:strand:- start:3049 stop:4143 length:1095 start_codon:yes stop_codon:yes gene_type:complete